MTIYEKNDKAVQFRAYKQKDLSKENLWPDAITYEGVKYRVRNGKNIKIIYSQGYKNPVLKELFLDFSTSQKITRGLELIEKLDAGEIRIEPIKQ